uniref:MYND-type domain-containing protein n=1 Tax=Arion vulgaris TaxID=1028688 RepID=A0A0B7ADV6_9EUPU
MATNSPYSSVPCTNRGYPFIKESAEKNETQRFLAVEHECASCGKRSYNMKACTRCWCAKYCNRSCQKSHWILHKMECIDDPTKVLYYKGGRVVEVDMAPSGDSFETSCNEDALFLDLDKCPKNGYNDHAYFIPVNDMTLDKLPEEIRRQDVLDYIMAQSKMTVRVLVNWTSKNRPDNDACARFRDSRRTRTASGTYILDNSDMFVSKECPIPNCHRTADLGPNHMIYEGDLKIFTNKHVLYDDDELSKIVVDFFYNTPNRAGVIREYAIKLFYTKPSSDKTFFKVTIHDKELFHRLEQYDIERGETFHKLSPSLITLMSSFAVVISHPHGMPKKISIGRVLEITEENISEETMGNAKLAGVLERKWFESNREEDYGNYMACLGQKNLPVYKIMYDTPTCQGSSGAPVLIGGRECTGVWGPFMANHSAYDIDSNLNFLKVVRFA